MKKSLFFLNMAMVLLLVTSVIAAGSSTSSKTVPSDNFKTDEGAKDIAKKKIIVKPKSLTAEQKNTARNICEKYKNRKERIRCRLKYIKKHKEEFKAPDNKAPEACRRLGKDKMKRCKQFYENSQKCYLKKGKSKNKCFKHLANFANAKLKDEKENKNKNKKSRDYVILLLYDIQEKIEKAIENERVDADKGAEAIDKIVEIKEDILNGIKKNVIKPKMLQLRTLLKDLKSKIDQNAN
jgi:hypothetical protein